MTLEAGPGELWSRRRKLERQLHDGPALRIAALALRLGLLAEKLPDGEDGLRRDVADLQAQLHAVQQELRAIADAIYPPLLYEAGLGPALLELADRVAVPLRVDVDEQRGDRTCEAVTYFTVLEIVEALDDLVSLDPLDPMEPLDGLDSLAVPLRSPIDVRVRRDGAGLVLEVAGVDDRHLAAVGDRVHPLVGVVEMVTTADGTIRVRVPCG